MCVCAHADVYVGTITAPKPLMHRHIRLIDFSLIISSECRISIIRVCTKIYLQLSGLAGIYCKLCAPEKILPWLPTEWMATQYELDVDNDKLGAHTHTPCHCVNIYYGR